MDESKGIVKRILMLDRALSGMKDKQARAQLKLVREAEKLDLKAAENSGNAAIKKMILSQKPDLEDELTRMNEENVQVSGEKKVQLDRKKQYNRVDSKGKKRYNKNVQYSQYYTLAMQWAFSSETKPGDIKILYNPHNNTWNKLVADDSEERYGTLLCIEDTPENAEAITNIYNEVYNEDYREEQGTGESIRENYERYRDISSSRRDDNIDVEEQDSDGRSRGVHARESELDGERDTRQSSGDSRSIKFNLKERDHDLDDFFASDDYNLKEEDPLGDFFGEDNDGGPVYKVSGGKVRKLIADNTRMKVYSRAESEAIINQIVSEQLSFGELYGVLAGKSKREVIDILWEGLNSADVGEQRKVALDVAEYIIKNASVESICKNNYTKILLTIWPCIFIQYIRIFMQYILLLYKLTEYFFKKVLTSRYYVLYNIGILFFITRA